MGVARHTEGMKIHLSAMCIAQLQSWLAAYENKARKQTQQFSNVNKYSSLHRKGRNMPRTKGDETNFDSAPKNSLTQEELEELYRDSTFSDGTDSETSDHVQSK